MEGYTYTGYALMTIRELMEIMAVLKNTKPSPVHQIEAFEAWEEIANSLGELFGKLEPTFDVNRFDAAIGLSDEYTIRGIK